MRLRNTAFLGLALSLSICSLTGAQVIKQKPPLKIESTPPVNVQILDLTAAPSAPKSGDQVTVKMRIQNKGTAAVSSVPWAIHWWTGNTTLAKVDQPNVGPGAIFEVSALWTATPGEQRLQGYVDPDNRIKNTAPASSISKDIVLNVPRPPRIVTQVLNFEKAKLAGAQFNYNCELEPCPANYYGVFSPRDSSISGLWQFTDESAVFILSALVKVTIRPEAFKNFRLKNGWVISDIQVAQHDSRTAVWQWLRKPPLRSNDPFMQMELRAESMIGGKIMACVKVIIEGPEGTDPYN